MRTAGSIDVSTRESFGLPQLPRAGRLALVVFGVLLAVFVAVSILVGVYLDWLWFGEVGFRQVWLTVLGSRLVLFTAITILIGASIFAALWLAFRFRPIVFRPSTETDPLQPVRSVLLRRPRTIAFAVAVPIGLVCGQIAQSSWPTLQLFVRGGSFGAVDPQFGHDIGFYVFDLPFYRFLVNWLFIAVFLAFLAGLAAHYLLGGIRISGKTTGLTRAARVQLAVLLGLFIALKAVSYWLDRYSLLSSDRKEPTFTGAGYTDVNAVLPSRLILCAIALVCAAAVFSAIVVRDLRIPAMAVALLVFSSIMVGGLWPFAVEQLSVRPNAADMEGTYIERNIAATRDAYAVGPDRVEYENYPGVGSTPPPEVPQDAVTIANARLLDPAVLSRTFTQQQQLKNFYTFAPTLDLDRYEIDGRRQDYVVAVRELTPSALSDNQRHWVNRHTVYTHGNGFVAAPANRVNAAVREAAGDAASSNSGYPIYAVSDIATQASRQQIIPVQQPRIYYGEVISDTRQDYAIVGGGNQPREYDTDASTYTYTGSGGVPIGPWPNRLAFAVRHLERNILFSKAIGSDSKILFHRDPRTRVELVAPWLTTDNNPYPAVVDGRIVWIVDAYTTADGYPYAKRSSLAALSQDEGDDTTRPEEIAYVRNSVKATVDAYDGTVTLFQVDENDPVLDAWMQVFPNSVQPPEAISAALRSHFRYPEDLFAVQRQILAKYHVDEPREFFTTNAFWSVPSDPTNDSNAHQPPYYVLLGEDGTSQPSFRLSSAMVGFNREFLSAYLSAHSDPDCYGTISVLQLPTDTLTQGPQQIQNSMISDTRVASERTLLERSNRIHYGNLITLPIADGGVLYIEPLFTERISTTPNGSTFPQLARVLVSYRDPDTGGVLVGYAPTIAEALGQVFGDGTAALATSPGGSPAAAPSAPPRTGPPPPPASTTQSQPGITGDQLDELQSTIDAIRDELQRLQDTVDDLAPPGG